MFDLNGVILFGIAEQVITSNMYSTNLYNEDGQWDDEHHNIGTYICCTFKPRDFGLNIAGGVQLSRFEITAFYTQGLNTSQILIREARKPVFQDLHLPYSFYQQTVEEVDTDTEGRVLLCT